MAKTGPMSPDDITIDPSALLDIRHDIQDVLDRHGWEVIDAGQYLDGSLAEIFAENADEALHVVITTQGGA